MHKAATAIKYSVLAPLMVIWLYIMSHVILGFYVPLFWIALKEIFNV